MDEETNDTKSQPTNATNMFVTLFEHMTTCSNLSFNKIILLKTTISCKNFFTMLDEKQSIITQIGTND